MASRRAERRRSCERKTRFVTSADAEAASYGGMLVYTCRFCSGFHIGHPPPRLRARTGLFKRNGWAR